MRALVVKLQDAYRVSQRRAIRALGVHLTTVRYKPTRPLLDAPIQKRIEEIALVRVRNGYKRTHVLLRREGWKVNHKRVHRIYRKGLNLRSKRPRRKRTCAHWLNRPEVIRPYDCWTTDFVSNQLFNGKRFRVLTVMDQFTRECLTIHADQSIKGEDVASIMDRLIILHGIPKRSN